MLGMLDLPRDRKAWLDLFWGRIRGINITYSMSLVASRLIRRWMAYRYHLSHCYRHSGPPPQTSGKRLAFSQKACATNLPYTYEYRRGEYGSLRT